MRVETRKGTMKIAGVGRMRREKRSHCRNLQNIGSVSKEPLPFQLVMISIGWARYPVGWLCLERWSGRDG
jgi:hypothetical protein